MNNFILPRAYEASAINNYFQRIVNFSKGNTYPGTHIMGVEGSLPYAYWNSGKSNNNRGRGIFYSDLLNSTNFSAAPIIFNCDNLLLSEKDFADSYMNQMLQLFQNGSTMIELNNKSLMQYIHNKYPYYKFVASEHYYLTGQLNYEEDKDLFKYFICSAKNQDFIKQIKNKKQLIVNINNTCFDCSNFAQCDLIMQGTQYNYSSICAKDTCKKFQQGKLNCLTIDQLKQFNSQGVYNFLIEDNFTDNQDYFYFLLDYFIIPEKQRFIIEQWERKGK